MFLGISSLLSTIECFSSSEREAFELGWTGATLGYKKKKTVFLSLRWWEWAFSNKQEGEESVEQQLVSGLRAKKMFGNVPQNSQEMGFYFYFYPTSHSRSSRGHLLVPLANVSIQSSFYQNKTKKTFIMWSLFSPFSTALYPFLLISDSLLRS